ncbi:MAG TPA: hypothetical protein VJJ81_00200 [Candidatus Babeliales bacterium]|nr:hypothetical protein [Candidatus Babeliales bacterium]
MKQVTSSLLLLSVTLLTGSSEMLSKVKSKQDTSVEENNGDNDQDGANISAKPIAAPAGAITPIPTAENALASAKKAGEQAHRDFIKEHSVVVEDLKRIFEDILERVHEIEGHAANARAGAAYEGSLAETAKHPAHKDHPDVKKASGAVVTAQSNSEGVASKALEAVSTIKKGAVQLQTSTGENSEKIKDQTMALAKPNTNAAMAMGVSLTKSGIDLDANAKLADINSAGDTSN